MSKTVKIRLTQGRSGPAGVMSAGAVIDVDPETANRYVAAKQAIFVQGSRQTTTKANARETATSKKAATAETRATPPEVDDEKPTKKRRGRPKKKDTE